MLYQTGDAGSFRFEQSGNPALLLTRWGVEIFLDGVDKRGEVRDGIGGPFDDHKILTFLECHDLPLGFGVFQSVEASALSPNRQSQTSAEPTPVYWPSMQSCDAPAGTPGGAGDGSGRFQLPAGRRRLRKTRLWLRRCLSLRFLSVRLCALAFAARYEGKSRGRTMQ